MTMSKTVVISKNVYFTYTAINNSYFCTDTYPNRVIDREREIDKGSQLTMNTHRKV